jgi:protocatechuate 3,4-dioxygenase beta subunit
MGNLRTGFLCVLSLIMTCDALAQEVIINRTELPMQPPVMGPRQLKAGTARIRGRVLSADGGGPVRRAQVRASGPEIGSKAAMTDAEGRYEFRDLPAGRFSLSATKSGFVTVQYGQTRPFESGTTIELVEAQIFAKADIAMPRGSVIAGRVLDEFGDPVADATVSAMRSAWAGGRRRLQPTGRMAQTNDLGQYRIYGLPPGDYYVSATLRSDAMMDMAMISAMAGGAGPGLTGSGGAGPGGAAGPTGSNPNSGYAPTYFPGTSNGADAQRLTLAAGQEAQGTDFALLPVRLVKITGVVINSEGKPVEGSMVNAVPRGGEVGMMMMGGMTRTDKDGTFSLANVAPGDYTLQTRPMQIRTMGGPDTMTFDVRVGGVEGLDAETGSLPISVGGEDVPNVVITTSRGATASGRLQFEGGAKPTELAGIRISSLPADGGDSPGVLGIGAGAGTVTADSTFTLRGLTGTRLIRVMPVPAGWMLKSVAVNGADVTDTGIEFKSGEALAGLEVVLTSKVTDVSGTVKGSSGQPVKDYTVVVFSDDPERWVVPFSRHVASARPNQAGRFELKSLPPGGYYAIANEYIAQGEWGDPEVLERLKVKATKFKLDEGESRTLDLTLR